MAILVIHNNSRFKEITVYRINGGGTDYASPNGTTALLSGDRFKLEVDGFPCLFRFNNTDYNSTIFPIDGSYYSVNSSIKQIEITVEDTYFYQIKKITENSVSINLTVPPDKEVANTRTIVVTTIREKESGIWGSVSYIFDKNGFTNKEFVIDSLNEENLLPETDYVINVAIKYDATGDWNTSGAIYIGSTEFTTTAEGEIITFQKSYIYTSSGWVLGTPYVWNGSEWKEATPYIWDGSEWK